MAAAGQRSRAAGGTWTPTCRAAQAILPTGMRNGRGMTRGAMQARRLRSVLDIIHAIGVRQAAASLKSPPRSVQPR